MYDNLKGNVKCLNCGKEFIADEQIKWADCSFKYYTIGDTIPVSDGEYYHGSYIRKTLDTQCPYCRKWQHFKAIIKNGTLKTLEATEIFNLKG